MTGHNNTHPIEFKEQKPKLNKFIFGLKVKNKSPIICDYRNYIDIEINGNYQSYTNSLKSNMMKFFQNLLGI